MTCHAHTQYTNTHFRESVLSLQSSSQWLYMLHHGRCAVSVATNEDEYNQAQTRAGKVRDEEPEELEGQD